MVTTASPQETPQTQAQARHDPEPITRTGVYARTWSMPPDEVPRQLRKFPGLGAVLLPTHAHIADAIVEMGRPWGLAAQQLKYTRLALTNAATKPDFMIVPPWEPNGTWTPSGGEGSRRSYTPNEWFQEAEEHLALCEDRGIRPIIAHYRSEGGFLAQLFQQRRFPREYHEEMVLMARQVGAWTGFNSEACPGRNYPVNAVEYIPRRLFHLRLGERIVGNTMGYWLRWLTEAPQARIVTIDSLMEVERGAAPNHFWGMVDTKGRLTNVGCAVRRALSLY